MHRLLFSTTRFWLALAIAMVVFVGSSASAVPVPINNFSFEAPELADGAAQVVLPNDWSSSGGSGNWYGVFNVRDAQFAGTTGSPGTLPAPADGVQIGFLQFNGAAGYLYQNVGALLPSTEYTLTLAVGHRLDNRSAIKTYVGLVNGSDFASGTVLNSTESNFDYNAGDIRGIFTDVVVSFTTPSTVSGDLTIAVGVTAGMGQGNSPQTAIDNVRLEATTQTTAIPGDFDSDGDVDGADFVAWQTNFPKATGAVLSEGDADADADVDGADFVVWQTNFPFPSGSGVVSVPEPNGFLASLMGAAVWLLWYRWHSTRCEAS
jgi:hypothetical protein